MHIACDSERLSSGATIGIAEIGDLLKGCDKLAGCMQQAAAECRLHSEGSRGGVTIGALNGQEVLQVLLLLGSLRCPLCPDLWVALLDELLGLRQLNCEDKYPCTSHGTSSVM